MSPCGGYAGGLKSRVAYSRSKGLIGEKDTQLKMSNPTYYAAFRDRVMDMIRSYDMNLFKFDRMGAGKTDVNGCDAPAAAEVGGKGNPVQGPFEKGLSFSSGSGFAYATGVTVLPYLMKWAITISAVS